MRHFSTTQQLFAVGLHINTMWSTDVSVISVTTFFRKKWKLCAELYWAIWTGASLNLESTSNNCTYFIQTSGVLCANITMWNNLLIPPCLTGHLSRSLNLEPYVTEPGYLSWHGGWLAGILFPAEERYLSLRRNVQTGFGAHPAS
jgi:hypothetical protein